MLLNQKNKLYFIDFGLSKKYIENGMHVEPAKRKKKPVGTIEFTSTNSLEGGSYSRKDEIEQIAYSILFISVGRLPWFPIPEGVSP